MKKRNDKKQDVNLVNLVERFHSEERCRDYLEELRWPDKVSCPRCGSVSVYRVIERGQFDCNSCRYQFSVTSGTIFHDTHLPLWKWFLTVYMMVEAKKGVSANQMKRTLKVSYRTAWYLCHRIRAAMTNGKPNPLHGIVEVDETWIGGKAKNVRRGYRGNKVVVAGAVERGGDTLLEVIPDTTRKTLHGFIDKYISDDAEAIYTDEWPAYKGIVDESTRHETANHSADEWVRGDVHTNSVENIWSLFKRSVVGSYHKVSHKHLDAYFDELEWRFNNRENPYLFRDTLMKLLKAENLEYKALVAAKDTKCVPH